MSLLSKDCSATVVPDYGFSKLFSDCKTLITAPELPASKVGAYGYADMFNDCDALIAAPNLPAEELGVECYSDMFYTCESLETAPSVLPATTLAKGCYKNMFFECKSLTTAPKLPATTLAEECYSSMFFGCKSLSIVSDLPATTLPDKCYNQMFCVCGKIDNISVAFTDWNTDGEATSDWLLGVAGSGFFYYSGELVEKTGESYMPDGWTLVNRDADFLCFTAEEATDIAFSVKGAFSKLPALEYSTDLTTWTDYTIGDNISLSSKGNKVYFRAVTTNGAFASDTYSHIAFTSTGKVAASGNIMSLLDKTYQQTSVPYNAFNSLFYGCTTLTSTPRMPATEVNASCYAMMYKDCTGLLTAPDKLPAETLAKECFYEMFDGCTNLKTAPKIPATTMAEDCCNSMFLGCTSLTSAPELPAKYLATRCYYQMFNGCNGLTSVPELPATTLASQCYQYMFRYCTEITEAPALPATTLVTSCYQGMFMGCENLNKMEVSFTEWDTSESATEEWLKGVAESGTFYCHTSLLDLTKSGSNHEYVPSNWKIVYPGPAVTLNEKGFATFSSAVDFSVKTAGVKAYVATVIGTTITLELIKDVIYSGYGVLLYGKPGTTVDFDYGTAQDFIYAPTNDLQPTTTYSKSIVDIPTSGFTYVMGTDGMFHPYEGTTFVANRAYFNFSTDPLSSGAKFRIVFDDETPTGITLVGNDSDNEKCSATYNLAGQRVSANTKGIVIVNGKKVIR